MQLAAAAAHTGIDIAFKRSLVHSRRVGLKLRDLDWNPNTAKVRLKKMTLAVKLTTETC